MVIPAASLDEVYITPSNDAADGQVAIQSKIGPMSRLRFSS
ncbi:hypothetical protein BXY51_000787 [Actinoplanes cyaneus]|nr:hypothetical protein [Actinoplanes cyaneus]